jgi:hypothetical protein
MIKQSLQETIECKFKIGDLVQMRAIQLKLRKYLRFVKEDIGVVTDVELQDKQTVSSKPVYTLTVYWQIRDRRIKIYDYRVKKIGGK